jgi:hypothetical protein
VKIKSFAVAAPAWWMAIYLTIKINIDRYKKIPKSGGPRGERFETLLNA